MSLLGLSAGLAAGVLGGPLWLDEALSVEIAQLPLGELQGALRQDGSPPLYYLLLHAWTTVYGTGTVAVRMLTVLTVPFALVLVWLVGRRLGGTGGGRAAVVVLATLPWTMRFGSETRMYALVVVIVLAGTLALLAVRRRTGHIPVVALAVCAGALLLTHYWSLFLLAAVGLWHLRAALRCSGPARRVVVGLVGGGLLFLPWLPTFLFQAQRTGAPWASPPGLGTLLRTPTFWGGGAFTWRVVMAVLLMALVVVAARRLRAGQALALVALGTLLLAWTQTAVLGGAYTGRYTAVVVPLVCVAAGLGATALPGRRLPALALALVALTGIAQGVPAAARERTPAGDIAATVRASSPPGALLVSCPDQLAPAVQRLLGTDYEQVVYPTLGPPQRIDWVDYAQRQAAAEPRAIAAQVDALAQDRELLVLTSSGYRTFGLQCEALMAELITLRGPAQLLLGEQGTTGPLLYLFD